jgi:hypothetical protein
MGVVFDAGVGLLYLGFSLLLSRLSAEAANIRHDINLLWTNKFDRRACAALHACMHPARMHAPCTDRPAQSMHSCIAMPGGDRGCFYSDEFWPLPPLQAHDAPQPDGRECDAGAGQLDARAHQRPHQPRQGPDSLPRVGSCTLKYHAVLLQGFHCRSCVQPQALPSSEQARTDQFRRL